MAAIDKICFSDYNSYQMFKIWCINHKPSLLYKFYDIDMTMEYWNKWKEEEYCYRLESNNREYNGNWKDVDTLRAYYKSEDYNAPYDQLIDEVNSVHNEHDALQDKESYKETIGLPVFVSDFKTDKYLLWHCPLREVRNYLTDICGYEIKWYYELLSDY